MRSYEQMVEDGDWPPTNRQFALFLVGMVVGGFITWGITYVYFTI